MENHNNQVLVTTIGINTLVTLSLCAAFAYTNLPQDQIQQSVNARLTSFLGGAGTPPSLLLQKGSVQSQQELVVAAVEKANPAVVSIVITKDVPVMEQYMQNVDPFGGGMGGFSFQVPQYRQNGTQKQDVGGGSGFIISADGLVVTNKHVVSDTSATYTLITIDGKKHAVTVVARDPSLDIAILRITDAGKYPFVTFADSGQLKLGQSAIAIGNALAEYRNSVSVGVVSGLSRSITASDHFGGAAEQVEGAIQTDAAINPGNSGGPLLNLDGNVIGVNVAVGQGENLGFALPASSVRAVVESVQKTGKIIRPYLGVRYTPIDSALKEKNVLSYDYGVLVGQGTGDGEVAVIPGSPANKAGIVENDIILKFAGEKIDTQHTLSSLIRNKNVGDTAEILLSHKGQEKVVRVTLDRMPE